MMTIGITGGIGAGKTSVCRVFESLGVAVFYTDGAAKFLMKHNSLVRSSLIAHFGCHVYDDAGEVNKKYMSEVVFNDEHKRQIVNDIVHPAVHNHFYDWVYKQKGDYVLYESALLLEQTKLKCDRAIVVYAPEQERVDRVVARNHCTREDALARIASQMCDEQRNSKADFIINNSEQRLIIPQVLDFHKKFVELSLSLMDS